jgi:menaquinone-dependent protoporphyrinogen oxidase
MMGRILIVFDTVGGSTREIIQWIKEGANKKGAHVDVKLPGDVTSLDYDLIAVGTPIYNDIPMKSVRDFLRRGDLSNKKIALFVVCSGGVFGMRNLMVKRYLEGLRHSSTGVVVKQTSFDSAFGPWRKVNRQICIDFGKDLALLPYNPPAAMETA